MSKHLLETEGRDLSANRLALVGPQNPRNRGRGRQEGSGVWTVWMQLCRSFASRQDCACIGVLGIASERSQLYALLVGSQNVDPEDGACAEPEVSRGPFYGPLPCFLFVYVCLGWPDPDSRDPACCRVRVPGYEYRAPRPSSPTAWWAVGLQTGLADPRGKPGPRPPPPPLWLCSPRGLPCGRRTERLRCERSLWPVRRDARRCAADGRLSSRHSRLGGHQYVRESRPPRSSIRPCCTPSFGPCTQLCLCAPMCRHGPQCCGLVCAHG